jgi:hypothetical protein
MRLQKIQQMLLTLLGLPSSLHHTSSLDVRGIYPSPDFLSSLVDNDSSSLTGVFITVFVLGNSNAIVSIGYND